VKKGRRMPAFLFPNLGIEARVPADMCLDATLAVYQAKVATSGAWSLVPTSRWDGQETARAARDSAART
jgi:hypothetical protein